MQLLGKLEIKSKEKIIEFLSSESTGRIASIDVNGFPWYLTHVSLYVTYMYVCEWNFAYTYII